MYTILLTLLGALVVGAGGVPAASLRGGAIVLTDVTLKAAEFAVFVIRSSPSSPMEEVLADQLREQLVAGGVNKVRCHTAHCCRLSRPARRKTLRRP
jgi:hypothetical protein